MKKTKTILVMLFVCFFANLNNANAQQLRYETPLSSAQAVAIAKQQLSATLELIEPTELRSFGFSTEDDFSKIEIGNPFFIAAFPQEKPQDENEISLSIQSIQIPLLIDGMAKCFIYISKEVENWKVVGIGGANYATHHPLLFSQVLNEEAENQIILNAPHIQQEYLKTAKNAFIPLFTMAENVAVEQISTADLIRKYYAVTISSDLNNETDKINK